MIIIKNLFIVLAIIGIIIVSYLSFIIPSNPNEIIPALTIISFDKPLWFCYAFGGSFIYLVILYGIYDRIA